MKKNLILVLLLLPATAPAQDTVAPTAGESTLSPRGENTGNYNVIQQWEFGYRMASVGGDDGKYRSDVNYGNGVRLLSSYLTVNSRTGHGRLFDEIVLTTQGLGNDPYQSITLRAQKNRWYRYDALWRSNDYFNPGLTVSDGEHLEDTTYQWQDHDLTILPQGWFQLRAGYSHTVQNGPALTTEQEFDPQDGVFPVFRNMRESYNEYRLAADVRFKGFRLSVLRRWEFFKDDTTDNLSGAERGTPSDASLLTAFTRAQPYRGRYPGWLVSLYGEHTWFAVNGRLNYTGGRGDFVQNETATGVDRFGGARNVQTIVTGSGDRPVTSGDLGFTLFPSSRLSFTNETSVSNTRMTGNNSYEQFNNATATAQTINFQFLGLLLITDAADVRYRLSKEIDVFAGFRYSDRQIRSTEAAAAPGGLFAGFSAGQSNQVRAGVAGLNWMPVRDLRLHLETEIGRNSHPFAPISLRDYHVIRSRAQYNRKSFNLGGGYTESDNANSIVITAYSSHARTYMANAAWRPRPWVSLDAAWSKLHLDTAGGLAFFAGSPASLVNAASIYISNIHAGSLSLRFSLTKRADLVLGYNITRDTGGGSASAATPNAAAAQLLSSVQTFPLIYETPLARLSVRLTAKLRYNVGYQYYGYREDFGLLSVNQGYRAQTGYTSLLWSF